MRVSENSSFWHYSPWELQPPSRLGSHPCFYQNKLHRWSSEQLACLAVHLAGVVKLTNTLSLRFASKQTVHGQAKQAWGQTAKTKSLTTNDQRRLNRDCTGLRAPLALTDSNALQVLCPFIVSGSRRTVRQAHFKDRQCFFFFVVFCF